MLAPPAPTLVAHERLCPVCGSELRAVPAVVAAPDRHRRRRRARVLQVALGTVTVVGLLLYGTDRTGDIVAPPGPGVSRAATLTPRETISRYYGYDVGPCLLVYRGDEGATYVCSQGDVATIEPGGAVHVPSLWP